MTDAYPAAWEADALLSNGRPLHLRPMTPGDGPALREFHDSLSERTVYYRFFGAKPHLSDKDVEYFTQLDHHDRVAFIALDSAGIAGVGRYDALGDGSAEVAFVIRDSAQGLGLGSILLEHLAAAARECGITRFVAEVLPDNSRMLATFAAAGYDVDQRFESDVIAVSFDNEPTAASWAVTQAREHRAEARSVERLLHPERVAVVGASRKHGGMGHAVLVNLVDGGFKGDLVAVHPEVDSIAGVRCVRSLSEVDGRVDLAVVVVPAEAVADVVRDAANAQVVGLVLLSEYEAQSELVDLMHRTGMRLVGPNALGVVNTDPAVRLNASLIPEFPASGNVGFFCQSGALGMSIVERLSRAGLGLSTFVSAGNRADVSGNDLLQYWEDDAATQVVMLYLETIGNARKFARVVHRISGTKPVVMVRGGGASSRHPLGHEVQTTDLEQGAVDRILGDCGAIFVDTIDQMIDVGRIAALQPLPTSTSVAIVGNSNALAVMAANACIHNGLSVVGEPRTFARTEPASSLTGAIRSALADPAVGAVVAIHVPPIEHPSDGELGDVKSTGKPLLIVSTHRPTGADSTAWFDDVENAVRALAAVARYATWRTSPEQATEPPPIEPARHSLRGGTYADATAVALLGDAGLDISISQADRPSPGLRVRLVDDPLFGAVISVAVDDPVAEALRDRSYRLAPVSTAAATTMIGELGASELIAEQVRGVAAQAVADLSSLAVRHPEVTAVDLRSLCADDTSTPPSVAAVSVSVADAPTVLEPAARRL